MAVAVLYDAASGDGVMSQSSRPRKTNYKTAITSLLYSHSLRKSPAAVVFDDDAAGRRGPVSQSTPQTDRMTAWVVTPTGHH